jgi:hypothetical protein
MEENQETDFDFKEFYLGEGSDLSSRRTLLSQDSNNRPSKKQKIGRPK